MTSIHIDNLRNEVNELAGGLMPYRHNAVTRARVDLGVGPVVEHLLNALEEVRLTLEVRKDLDEGRVVDYPDGYAVGGVYWTELVQRARTTDWSYESGVLTGVAAALSGLKELASRVQTTPQPADKQDESLPAWELDLLPS